jgi:uncharacterized Zn-binding protein involved in type VI secretion
MPAVARQGDPTTTGHGCDATTTITGPSTDVFANSIGIERKGDPVSPHTIPAGPVCVDHSAIINVGSPTVFVNGKPLARVGDSTDGGAITAGSPNVFSGTFVSFVIPPVNIPPAVQAAINRQTGAYVANPTAYKVESNDQVKQNFPGTAQGADGESLIDTDVVLASDIPSLLSQNLDEAGKGIWEETGMGGRASNSRITGIWKELGYPQTGAWLTDQTAWCMGYVNWVLKRCGYRFLQTAWAFDIRDKAAAYKAVKIPLNQGQPGDIALWSYGHVNFIYTASSGTYSFVGGNQSSSAKNVNNPSSGSVTRSWPSGYRTPGDNSLIGIWRPIKE